MDNSTPDFMPTDYSIPLFNRRPTALYIHIPFCVKRCPYCDFAVAQRSRELEEIYLDALALEFKHRLPLGFQPHTIYVGGGTPTELSITGFEKFAQLLQPLLNDNQEITFEANPGTLTPRKIETLKNLGCTRVSLGSQSFNTEVLDTLGRIHSAEQTYNSVQQLRDANFCSINLDIIFGVPGQSLQMLEQDIAQTLALEPEHISGYGLTYEPETEFYRRLQNGSIKAVIEDLEHDMFQHLRARLNAEGFAHYELSNYAKSGSHCVHNRVYWRNGSYFGLGNGAASHLAGYRTKNISDVRQYCATVKQQGHAIQEIEFLDPQQKLAESVYLALRRSEGVVFSELTEDFGPFELDQFALALETMTDQEFIEADRLGFRLTEKGLAIADSVTAEFLC